MKNESDKVAKYLLKTGTIEVFTTNGLGQNALCVAGLNNKLDLLELLCKKFVRAG